MSSEVSSISHLITYGENGEVEEVEEVKLITKITKRLYKKGAFFVQTFDLENLIMEKDYKLLDLKTLFILKKRLDFNNRIKTFRQSELAKELDSSQANISRAIKKLENDGIIMKDGHDYYFNTAYIHYAGDGKKKGANHG